jgi:hypothetical protein
LAKGKKTGGRTKGTPNKATADVKAHAQQYTTECIDILMGIARSAGEVGAARVMAAKEVLDRAIGKATQAVEHEHVGPIQIVVSHADERL